MLLPLLVIYEQFLQCVPSLPVQFVCVLISFNSQCLAIALDYKLNFTPGKSDQIPQLHERVAERIYHLLTTNGGLYIKIGMQGSSSELYFGLFNI